MQTVLQGNSYKDRVQKIFVGEKEMALNDPLANALSKINQFEKLGRQECALTRSSSIIKEVLGVLKSFEYISDYSVSKEGAKESIIIKLNGSINECGVIKPRFAIKLHEFDKFEKRYLPAEGMGILILSTVDGLSDQKKAREKKTGGRLIAYCY